MIDESDNILTRLPARLKDARKRQGLSLEAVAGLSGVSRSMVSQIERGESSPTISTLWNLTRALRVDFTGLLEDESNSKKQINILRMGNVPVINNIGQGCRISILSPPEDVGGHEVYDIRFEAYGALDSTPHAHGTTEQLTVIEGAVQLMAGDFCEILRQGDTARYGADVPHSISATGDPARVFLIVKNTESERLQ